MKRKQYALGNDARAAILQVATSIGNILGKTLGPAGRNYQTPEGITNDGRSILGHIRFDDECEDNIALAFHEIANRTDKEVGDFTTTATYVGTVLAENMIARVPDIDAPSMGEDSVMALSHRLEEEKDRAIELLKAKVVPVNTLEELEKVAFTSMEDREVAKIVAGVIFEAGPDSYTALEEGFSGGIETSIQAGIEMPLKLNYGESEEVQDVPVLVVNHLFEDYRELTPFMGSLVEFVNVNKTPFKALVIVAKKFSIPFMQRVAEVNLRSPMKVICMSNDYLDDSLFEDIAAFVDAKYVDLHPKSGNKVSDLKIDMCGKVDKFVATSKGAVFFGGNGTDLQEKQTVTRVEARLLQLNAELKTETNEKNRQSLMRRIAEFSGGKATIYVDAKTAAEKYYLKLKVQDCMNSCKNALGGGMVRGGGISFKEVADELGEDSLIANALRAPYARIQANAGGSLVIEDDVMDAYLGAESAIRNSVSVIKTVLTIEGLIADVQPSLVEDLGRVIAGE